MSKKRRVKRFRRRFIIVAFSILLLLLLAGLLVRPTFDIIGNDVVNIDLNSKFNDPGFKAGLGMLNLNKDVTVKSDINANKPGAYQVAYDLNFALFHIKKTRSVKVINRQDPVIKLVGDDNLYLNLGINYIDKGATATDNIDGDITEKIKVVNNADSSKPGVYKVIYSVIDSSNNVASLQRTVTVTDEPIRNVGVPILMYHFFYDASKGQTSRDNDFIEISKFKKQMQYLKDNNFYFPTWEELEKYLDGGNNLPNKSVIITIDDGSSTFFDVGYPVLKEMKVRATSFLITGWSGDPSRYNVDRSLISFQSHSNNMHRGGCKGGGGLFLCISDSEAIKDLTASIKTLGSSEIFCYPFGSYNNHDKELLAQVGFKMAVTVSYGKAKPGVDKLAIPRIRVNGNISFESFKASVN